MNDVPTTTLAPGARQRRDGARPWKQPDTPSLLELAGRVRRADQVSGLGHLRFLSMCLLHRRVFRRLSNAAARWPFARLFEERPELLHSVVCGRYFAAGWTMERRVDEFLRHVECLESVGPTASFRLHQGVELATLRAGGQEIRIALDKPLWFHREGVLTLSLAFGDTRLYSLSFALHREGDRLVATIGSIQGRKGDWFTEQYRSLTKSCFGTRPRDLIVEIFRFYCGAIGVTDMRAIRDAERACAPRFPWHRAHVSANYDEIWSERGAMPFDDTFVVLPLSARRRAADDIPANKRSLYRKRYAFLDDAAKAVAHGAAHAVPQPLHLV